MPCCGAILLRFFLFSHVAKGDEGHVDRAEVLLDLVDEGITKHKLIQFHSAHKYLVMCHHVEGYKELKLV